jgi:hypothetical protein
MKTIDHEFTLPDVSKRYEFVDPDAGDSVMAQLRMFKTLHSAIRAEPKNPLPTSRLG